MRAEEYLASLEALGGLLEGGELGQLSSDSVPFRGVIRQDDLPDLNPMGLVLLDFFCQSQFVH